MKLLFDENLSFKLCKRLADLFPDSDQVRLVGLTKASDPEVWHYAGKNGFALVSLDADFAERAILRGPPPKVIWLGVATSRLKRSKNYFVTTFR